MSDLELTMMRRVGELKAEVERLKKFNEEAMAHIAKEERKNRERLEMAEDENARLKAEVEQARKISGEGMSVTLDLNNQLLADNARLKAEVERLTNQNALATPRHLIASQDIKTLREQIEELKLENSQYEEHHKYGQNVITSLREEVERLTKAGDAMAELMFIDKDYIGSAKQESVVEWCKATDAKEGKPRA
jgi:DNA repair exonuclease SbcCD ATPase subunit